MHYKSFSDTLEQIDIAHALIEKYPKVCHGDIESGNEVIVDLFLCRRSLLRPIQ